jgi:predicted nucleic acid-binding protein
VEYVVLDTDVASLVFRQRLPAVMAALLAGKTWCLTFVTVGEMIQWSERRAWSPRKRAALSLWLSELVMIEAGWEAARTWGRIYADGQRRGRTYPLNDSWTAACCLTKGLPLATLNTKDFMDIAEHYGLVLLG